MTAALRNPTAVSGLHVGAEPSDITAPFNAQPWVDRALCPETDPESFFPEKGGSTKQAKKICALCEVRGECLEWALDREERFGIFGGKSERERRKIIKARRGES